jgi:hypothetical protein
MNIEPNSWFETIRPDEVAECWEGVLEAGLYQPLWDCVQGYKAPSPEESEEPCYGMDCVADFWDRFTPDQQLQLNQLAITNDRSPWADLDIVAFDPFNI